MVSYLQKQFIFKHLLHILLPVLFTSWCLHCKTPEVISQHIWTHYPLYLFSIWEMFRWNLLSCSVGTNPMFSEEKIKMGMQKMKVTCHTRLHCMMKLGPAKFHHNFPLFHCLESLWTFSNASQSLLSVAFNVVLKSWSSN